MRFEVLVFDGFDELDSLAPFEVFANGAQIVPDLEVSLVTATGQTEVTGSHGVRFAALPRWAPEEADVLLIPGGGFADHGPGVRDLIAEGTLPRDLGRLRPRQVLASVCTGAMLLAAAGLLKGRPATTHPIAHDALTAAGAELSRARVVDDGDVVTSGGVMCGLDLAYHLVARLISPDLAQGIAEAMQYERPGSRTS